MACAVGDTACTSGCRTRFPTGYDAEAAALQSCEAAQCATVCQVLCGGYVYANAGCAACGVGHCCDASTACATDTECSVLSACERACAANDDDCLALCELAHPSAVANERTLGACLNRACAASCVPPQWACLENPGVAPIATGPPITVTYGFIDYETSNPIDNLNIRPCAANDAANCANPLVAMPVQTDRTGQAKLSLGTNYFDGYTEIWGAGYGPVLLYLPTLTKDFVVPVFPMATQATLAHLANGVTGNRQNADLGTIVVTALDCGRNFRGGVSLAIDPSAGSTGFYFGGSLTSTSAMATGDGYASGGFFNVAANTGITVTATVVENGLAFPPRPPVYVRPGTGGYTHVVLHAAPP